MHFPFQLVRRIYKGIPLQLRGEVWCLLLDIPKIKEEKKDFYEVRWPPGTSSHHRKTILVLVRKVLYVFIMFLLIVVLLLLLLFIRQVSFVYIAHFIHKTKSMCFT